MATRESTKSERVTRRRGRRPEDAAARRERVEKALAALAASRTPFTMADVADRAGISRATLYRDAGLRDLIGRAGEGPALRPVDSRAHRELQERAATLAAERRALRRQLRESEKRLREAEDRFAELQQNAKSSRNARLTDAAAERLQSESYASGFAAGARAAGRGGRGGANDGALLGVAARLPRPALVAARRSLARALHPDLFAKDPAAALLATELLKQINALIGPEE